MSFWVVAYCERSVGRWTAKDLLLGIAPRLPALTALFDPDDEEDPDEVLARLRIAPYDARDPDSVWHLRYRDDLAPIVIDRAGGKECAGMIKEELAETAIGRKRGKGAKHIREVLRRVSEQVSFDLKMSALESMGFPLAVAAAAWFVERCGGVIRSGDTSWMVPTEDGVEIVLELDE
jgi:hypothetical protein